MITKARRALAVGAVLLLTGCGIQNAGDANDPQQAIGFSATCTTSSTGYCTVNHPLGDVPTAVAATPRLPMHVAVNGRTETDLRVRVCKTLTSAGACTPFVGTATIDFIVTKAAGTYPSASATPSVPLPTTPPASAWPNPSTTGTPAGWTPMSTRTTDLVVTTAGTTVQDVRLTGASIVVRAANVTVRRVEILGGTIDNVTGGTCYNGLTVEDTSLLKGSTTTGEGTPPAIGTGGYAARGVKIQGWPEGFRVGGRSNTTPCGPVLIEDSWAQLRYPDTCTDWHGDGVQGYDGAALTIRNTYLELIESGACGGTAPFFYPGGNQGNVSATVDRLIVKGGGYPFRMGTPGSVTGLRVVQPWGYGPTDVTSCAQLTSWSAHQATLDTAYQPTDGAVIPCG